MQKPRKISADARDFCEHSEGFGRVFARATRSRRTSALQTCQTCFKTCNDDLCMHFAFILACLTQKSRKINADARDFCESFASFGEVFARATGWRRTSALQTCPTCRAACRNDLCMFSAVAARVLDAKIVQNQRARARFWRKFRGFWPSFCARNAQQAHVRAANMSHVSCSVQE